MSRSIFYVAGALGAVAAAAVMFNLSSASDEAPRLAAVSTSVAPTPAAGESEVAETTVDGAVQVAQAPAGEIDPTLAEKGYALGDIVIGDPEAPVTIIEYASMTCPHCASFHNDVLPALTEKYVDTGKANVVVREVFFDQAGLFATAVARCGGAAAYERYMNVFFKRQAEWSRAGGQDAVVNEIRQIGRLGGLPADRVDSCLTDQAFLTELFETSQAQMRADQVEATPTFLINGEKIRGARSLEVMSEVIDRKLGE